MDRMVDRKGVIAIPLPIVNPPEVSEGLLYITKCPVCRYGFSCRNIVVGECNCTYHHFCAVVHFGPGVRSCTSPICSEIYSDDWHESFGALSLSIAFKDSKLDKTILSSTTFTRRSSAGSLSTNCKCSCKFYWFLFHWLQVRLCFKYFLDLLEKLVLHLLPFEMTST